MSGFAIDGVSSGLAWNYGLGTGPGAPNVAPLSVGIANTIPPGMGPAGFNALWVASINTNFNARLDPACTCASCGVAPAAAAALGPAFGCPATGNGFTLLNGGGALSVFTDAGGGGVGPPGTFCGAGVFIGGVAGACAFNPMLTGAQGSLEQGGGRPPQDGPAMSPPALALLIGLILAASAYLLSRRRPSSAAPS